MTDTSDTLEPTAERQQQPATAASQHDRAKGRIVVGVDGSESSIDALRFAADFAAAFGAPLEAIAAWHLPAGFEVPLMAGWSPEKDAQDILEAAANEVFGSQRPDWYRATTRRGTAAGVLISASKDAQTLVVGSRGRGGFRGLTLGSTGAACARHAHCPVLIMRPAEITA